MIEVFDSGARMTWDRLQFGEELRIRQGEVTLTDTLLLHLKAGLRRWPGAFLIEKTPAAEEARTGADLELWVGSASLGWLAFVIQAKRIDYVQGTYRALYHRVVGSGRLQHDLIREYAKLKRLVPVYWLYNAWHASVRGCPRGWCGDVRSWGCSVAPLTVVAGAVTTKGSRNFDWIHNHSTVVPLRCMFEILDASHALPGMAAADRLARIRRIYGAEFVLHRYVRRDLLEVMPKDLLEESSRQDKQPGLEDNTDPESYSSRYAALIDLSKIPERNE